MVVEEGRGGDWEEDGARTRMAGGAIGGGEDGGRGRKGRRDD